MVWYGMVYLMAILPGVLYIPNTGIFLALIGHSNAAFSCSLFGNHIVYTAVIVCLFFSLRGDCRIAKWACSYYSAAGILNELVIKSNMWCRS